MIQTYRSAEGQKADRVTPLKSQDLRRCVVWQRNGQLFACGGMILADRCMCDFSALRVEKPHIPNMKRTALPPAQSANCVGPTIFILDTTARSRLYILNIP